MTQRDADVICTLRNGRGMRVAVSARDASLVSWWAPDRYGRMAEVLATTVQQSSPAGWQCDTVSENSLSLSLRQEGLAARLRYYLDDDGSLHIEGEATADAMARLALPAPWFNLRERGASVADHALRLAADRYYPNEAAASEPRDVAGSAFDFRQSAPISARLAWPGASCPAGLDHVFCLAGDVALREAATVTDPASGRVLRFFTNSLQLHVRTDASRFNLAPLALDIRPGQVVRQMLVYRLGVADIDALGVNQTINRET
jgi:aldose 1-epimerase